MSDAADAAAAVAPFVEGQQDSLAATLLTPVPSRKRRHQLLFDDGINNCLTASVLAARADLTTGCRGSPPAPCPSPASAAPLDDAEAGADLDGMVLRTPVRLHRRRIPLFDEDGEGPYCPASPKAAAASASEESANCLPASSSLLPSREAYLSAKMQAWEAACANDPDVTYERPPSPPPDLTAASLEDRRRLFDELVRKELSWHRLPKWRVVIDSACARAGSCCFRTKQLSFSCHLVRNGSYAEWRDTVTHEAAHAIAGAKHAHDLHWQSIARRIGCSGRIYYDGELGTPSWVLQCPNGCFAQHRFKRAFLNRVRLCATCGTVCVYTRRAVEQTTETQ